MVNKRMSVLCAAFLRGMNGWAVDWEANLLPPSLKHTHTHTHTGGNTLSYTHIWTHMVTCKLHTHTHTHTHTLTDSLQLQFVLICARRWEGGQSDTDGWTAVWTESERKNEGRKETGLTVKCIHYSCGNKCLVRNRGDITIHQPACPPPPPPPPPPPLVTATGVCNFPFFFLPLLLSFGYFNTFFIPPSWPPSLFQTVTCCPSVGTPTSVEVIGRSNH